MTVCILVGFAAGAGVRGQDAGTPGAIAQADSNPALAQANLAPSAPAPQLTPPPDNAPAAPPAAPVSAPVPATASTTPSNLSPHEISRLRREEIVRKQELVYRSDESLKTARTEEVAGNLPEARKDYLFSAEAYGSVSRSTNSYAIAAEGLTRVDFQLYDDALKNGDTARAKRLIDEVLKYNPNNAEANRRMVAINRALDNPNDTSLLGNPAVTPGLVAKVNLVQQLFAEAEQFRRTGQWDQAEARLRHILAVDPYNIGASKQLERIVAQKNKYDDEARLETRDERLRQVEEKWYPQITEEVAAETAQDGQATLTRETNFGLDEKLKDIFLSLDFTNATIQEATDFLSVESKRLDPDKKGVNFIVQPEASANAKPVTLTLNNVPLGEALRYICQLANVKYKVQDYAISIIPFASNGGEDLISRTFKVLPSFVEPPVATGAIGSAADAALGARPIATDAAAPAPVDEGAGDTVRKALEAKGLKFMPGASAVYTSSTGQLTVVDTPDQIELLEELVNAGLAPTLMVRVATKFVEINQTDLNDLTVNTAFNVFTAPGGLSSRITTPQFFTQLPGSQAFAPNSIDTLISPQTTQYNAFSLRSFIAPPAQINLLITALAQKKSFDLLSEPAVLTKSGEQGVLEAVRVFPYPISFDPPQLVTQTTAGSTNITTTTTFTPPTVIATTPTDFKRRNVGVRLVVKPQVTADNRTIDLSLFPEVTDFEGFINYGSAIEVANPDATQSLLSSNEINQPVFNTRRINTKVLIQDGSTVVLGGLIRDDIQNVNDKVPFLGDLPLVGRLFQSKAVTNTKRNLIIFVTANIYRNDGELLNPPDVTNTADLLTGRAGFAPVTPAAAQ